MRRLEVEVTVSEAIMERMAPTDGEDAAAEEEEEEQEEIKLAGEVTLFFCAHPRHPRHPFLQGIGLGNVTRCVTCPTFLGPPHRRDH